MKWIMLGLICTHFECHEVRAYKDRFVTEKECVAAANYYQARTAMYFKLRCVESEDD
jgi:hypothetical protein